MLLPIRRLTYALIATALVPLSAGAQIYKWVDEDGVVHYTDQPVQPSAERVAIRSGRTDNAAAQARLKSAVKTHNDQTESYLQGRDDKRAAEAQAEADREQRAADCEKARAKLNELVRAQRLYRVDENGERQYLSDDEAVSAREQAGKEISEYCD
jgi:hypothetical protein